MERAKTIPQPKPSPSVHGNATNSCFHCGRDVYGLLTIGAMRACGRSDCLGAALAAAGLDRDAA
jgi:hypothetical protein